MHAHVGKESSGRFFIITKNKILASACLFVNCSVLFALDTFMNENNTIFKVESEKENLKIIMIGVSI